MISNASASPSLHIYPDGTIGSEPADGQIFILYDINQKPVGTFRYDASSKDWEDITYDSNSEAPANYFNVDAYKCECGAEAVGSDRHSVWCQKYLSF